ncbi:hypothetical protein HK102_001416 [Quaeritorhiza haematococci]|nr:hypothetical protein HK102_001416 [Quaeritorhiza haematococci]
MAADSHKQPHTFTPAVSPVPTLFGVPLKWLSLITLVVQNSALVLVMRYSRTLPGPRYLPSTAVVMSEFTKLIICTFLHVSDESKKSKYTVRKLWQDCFGPESDWLKMMVPAVLYMIQNNLQYVAVTKLDAATFQVTYQMKILTTALFSVWMLNKLLTKPKWISLVLLTVGIALVQLPSGGGERRAEDDESSINFDQFVGLFAVTVACILSGLAGVWFEKVLKGSKASVWLRNIQLSTFSIIPGLLVGVYVMDRDVVAENGFFHGYNAWTWSAIACQAVGGLIVAVVVKYADNILKGFATSLSIILSCIASIFLFDFHVTTLFLIGSSLVLYATHMYGQPDPPQAKSSPSEMTANPKIDLQYVKVDSDDTLMDDEREHKYRSARVSD